jgi:hypothetical protein
MVNPVIMAYKYELSASDSLGNESANSPYHKTIHLEVSPGVYGFNLIWNTYEGFTFSTYKIHRKLGTDAWQLIDSIPSDNLSYTDLYVTTGIAYYYIEVIRYSPCNPSLKSGVYESVISNVGHSAPLGIKENQNEKLLVYPNPASDVITIEMPEIPVKSQLTIMDLNGREFMTFQITEPRMQFNISTLPQGVYFIRLTSEKNVKVGKIIKE